MSEPILSKISEILGAIIKPNHLMLVTAILSGVLLFDFLKIQENLGIQNEVKEYKFWIALLFFSAGGLLLLSFLSTCSSWIARHTTRVFGNWRAARATLSEGAGWILILMAIRKPDSTRLLTQHPTVRELRLLELIEDNSLVITGGDFQHFTLTERGLAAALPRMKSYSTVDDSRMKALFSLVTGANE